MAVTDPLVTPAEYQEAKGVNDANGASRDELVAVSRYVEIKAGGPGHFFTKDAAAVNRLYVGTGSRVLDLTYDGCPGIADTTGLTIKVDNDDDGSFADETAWAATDYELRPLNAALGSEPRPYTEIFVPDWSTKGYFPTRLRVQVTAIFGWPSVPEAIKSAVIELTAILKMQGPRAANRYNDLDQVFSTSREARSIVAELRQAYAGKVTL